MQNSQMEKDNPNPSPSMIVERHVVVMACGNKRKRNSSYGSATLIFLERPPSRLRFGASRILLWVWHL